MVYVYISKITECNALLPPFTDEKKITNKNTLAQKRTAYSLLYKAVKEVFDVDMDISKITKTENGKPVYPDIYFSISHSKELCAVAVSNQEVGIDIEEEIKGEREKRLRKKILHENESYDTDITELWTKKEAVFKLLGGKIFIPSETDTTAYHTDTKSLLHNGKKYAITIAAYNECKIEEKGL